MTIVWPPCRRGTFDDLTALTTLNLSDNDLARLTAGLFDDLTALTTLNLSDNSLTGSSSVRAGLLDNLTELMTFDLSGQNLTNLPAGLFDKLTKLKTVDVGDANALPCLPWIPPSVTNLQTYWNRNNFHYRVCGAGVTVSERSLTMKKSQTATYTVVLNTRPFRDGIVKPQNGGINGIITVTTEIKSGDTDAVTVTPAELDFTEDNWDTPQTITVTSVDLGSAPISHDIKGDSGGYLTFNKLSIRSLRVTVAGICDRTRQVRDAIVAQTLGKTDCADITKEDLEAITTLSVTGQSSLTTLKAGDFDGLTEVTTLNLSDNGLSSLPKGVFDKLTKLTTLNLSDNRLSSLPKGVFDKLTALTMLDLNTNRLSSLPEGIFDKLTALTTLYLNDNRLSSLPGGVFDKLTALTTLNLQVNPRLDSLPAIPALVTTLSLDNKQENYAASGAGVTVNRSFLALAPTETETYTVVLDAKPNPEAGDVVVTFTSDSTATATAAATADTTLTQLTFTASNWNTAQSITVTGVAAGSATISHSVSGGGYESATGFTVTATVEAGICSRTREVRHAIRLLTSDSHCADVTNTDLAGITTSPLRITGEGSLTTLKQGDFAGLTKLETLEIQNRNLTSLPKFLFEDLTSLTTLNLSANKLPSLKEGMLKGLTSLTDLDLASNNLSSLDAGVFDNLTELTDLDLASNNLSSLNAGVFDNLTKLTDLNLASNNLRSLDAGAFDNLTMLDYLNLRNNPLTCLPSIPSSIDLRLPEGKTKADYDLCGEAPSGGGGAPSGGDGGVTVRTPSAPPKPAVTPADRQVTLSWTAPGDDGGSAITGWQYAVKAGDNAYMAWQNVPGSSASTTTTTITGLTNGTAYQFKVRAVNSVGPGAESPASDVVTPSMAKEKIEEVVLSEPLKQVIAHKVTAVTSRISTISSDSRPTLPPAISLDSMVEDGAEFLWSHRKALNSGTPIAWEQVLSGRSFSFPLSMGQLAQAADANGNGANQLLSTLAVWGSADYSSYDNEVDGIEVDGDLFSAYIGADLQPRPDLITGLALGISRSEADYNTDDSEGTYNLRITSMNPYLSYSPSETLSLWASMGYGGGESELKESGGETITEQGESTSLAVGGRFQLWSTADLGEAEDSQMSLALKLDGATAQFRGVAAQVGRLAGEFSRTAFMEAGQFTTAVELGLKMRSDEAAGVELGGSVEWLYPETGFSSKANARVLLAGEDQQEWGIGGWLRYDPSTKGGLTIALEPSFGVTRDRLHDLWSLEDAELAVSTDQPAGRLKVELGYGFLAAGGLITPYTDFFLAEAGSRSVGMGLRYTSSSALEMDLKAEHQISGSGHPEGRVGLEWSTQL